MAKPVPILFLVDTVKLLEGYGPGGTVEHPIRIQHGFRDQILFRIAPKPNAIILGNVIVRSGDTLHWSALSIQSQEYSIHLTKYEGHVGLMKDLQTERYDRSYYIPKDEDQPDGPVVQVNRSAYRMTCHLPSPWGIKIGHWVLLLLDNGTGKVLGHYQFEFSMEVIGHLF